MVNRIFILSMAVVLLHGADLHASYSGALKYFQDKKYSESLKMAAEELTVSRDMEKDSPNYKLRYLAAHNHWMLGNYESAISHFKRCMDIRTEIADPYIDLALLLVEIKRYKDAETYVRKGLKIDKDNPMLFYILGRAAQGFKNYPRSKELFEKAISLDPEMYAAYNSLGMILMRMKKYSEANTAFSAAQALMPDSPEILNNIAMSLERQKKYSEALGFIGKAKKIAPDNKVILKNEERLKGRAREGVLPRGR
jgi:Flp pilus assembly protein TadD